MPTSTTLRCYFTSMSEIAYISPSLPIEGNMTAIGIQQVKSGIVIAADGRMRSKDPHTGIVDVESGIDEAIKIFEIKTSAIKGAYALAGSMTGENIDITQTCKHIESALSLQSFENVGLYLSAFIREVAREIAEKEHTPLFNPRKEGGWSIIDLFFAGYFNDQSFMHGVNIYHLQNQISTSNFPINAGILYGSKAVGDMMYDRNGIVANSPFADYQYRFPPNPELIDARECCVRYIKACCSPVLPDLDSARRALIGGTIRVARITKEKGFEWEPEEKGDSAAAESP